MPSESLIGGIAAVLTTVSFVPQVIKVLRERKTAGISLSMYALFTVGVGLWFVFGVMIKSLPVMLANGLTFVLAMCVLVATAAMRLRSRNGSS